MSTPAATASASGTHILVFPYPAQGHMLALLDLTGQLSLRGHKITILVTPKNLPILTPLLTTHPSIQTLVFPFPRHPNLPLGAEHVRDVGNRGNASVIAALSGLSAPIADWFKAHPSPPRAIISDFFLGWTESLAQRLGVPRIAFFSVGSFVSAVITVLFSHVDRFKGLEVVEFTGMPRSPSFREEHLPSIFRLYKKSESGVSESDWGIVKDGFVANLSSWGFVFNSLDALEGEYLEHFKKLVGHGRVYGVGPLSVVSLNRANPDKASYGQEHNVLNWLDNFEDGSVLYVSFGSQKWLSQPQLEGLGLALERCGAPFIWVVRGGGPNLDGFEGRVTGRGYVVKGWAPQVEILGHNAVGGFMTHCGWNSVMESVVAGVMMLAWPMEADQYVNARLLVEDMGIAVRACKGPDTVPDPNELGRVIREAMGRDAAKKQREARGLKEMALAAVGDGGRSNKDLNDFVKELAQIGFSMNMSLNRAADRHRRGALARRRGALARSIRCIISDCNHLR